MSEEGTPNPFDVMLTAYQKWQDPVSGELSRQILERAQISSPATLLDVCAGTGPFALAAAARGFTVDGIDLAPGVISVLSQLLRAYPGSSAHRMDALHLDYPNDTFDAAFSVVGVTNFGDGFAPAANEMVRVTRDGGLIGLVHWASPYGAPWYSIMSAAMRTLRDPDVDPLPPVFISPSLHPYANPAHIENVLLQAGCATASTIVAGAPTQLPEPEVAFDALDTMFGNFPSYTHLTVSQRQALQAAFANEIRAVRSADGAGPTAIAYLTLARK